MRGSGAQMGELGSSLVPLDRCRPSLCPRLWEGPGAPSLQPCSTRAGPAQAPSTASKMWLWSNSYTSGLPGAETDPSTLALAASEAS